MTMRSRIWTTALTAGAFAVLLASPSAMAADADPARHARMKAEYDRLQTDPQFQAILETKRNNPKSAEALDAYLRYLPISPMDFVELDMEAKRYEYALPRFLKDWHERWLVLHPDKARSLYGVTTTPSAESGESTATRTPAGTPVVGTNRNSAAAFSTTPELYQGEIQIGVNPGNVQQMVSSANSWDGVHGACGFDTHAIFYSSDGGATWGYTCAPGNVAFSSTLSIPSLASCSLGNVFTSDPAVYWDTSNNVFLNYMLICSDGVSTNRVAMVVVKSTDGGATWTPHGVIRNGWPGASNSFEDKNFYVIDRTPTSPFFNRHYTCWDRSNNQKFAHSSDGGATWTEVDLPLPSGGGFELACDIAVSKNGDVHVIWDILTCGASCSNERMFYAQSTNGGAAWSTPVLVQDFNLVGFSGANRPPAQDNRGISPFGSIDVDNSGGACDGTLYVTYSDWDSGSVSNNDIWVKKSTDDGATWSAAVKVNDDGLTGRVQFHPFLVVDQSTGYPYVAWHDTRNDSLNRAVEFFISRSTDCNVTWEANVKVSQPSAEFTLNPAASASNLNTTANAARNPNQYGEYLGLDVINGKAYVAWTDSRGYFPTGTGDTQDENVAFATVDFGGSTLIFGNGFETGDTTAWSVTQP